MDLLKFSPANTKLQKLAKKLGLKKSEVYSLNLLAGQTCPGANICKSQVIEVDNKLKIKDGLNCKFRCYAASFEVIFQDSYWLHKHNTELLRNSDDIVSLILSSLPKSAKVIRYHSSGDFFSRDYFNAAVQVAYFRPNIKFYAYTKSLHFVPPTGNLTLPPNLSLVYSLGGKYDYMNTGQLYTVQIVYSEDEAKSLGLEIDDNDFHAYCPNQDFALLVHGTQPANTIGAKIITQTNRRKVNAKLIIG